MNLPPHNRLVAGLLAAASLAAVLVCVSSPGAAQTTTNRGGNTQALGLQQATAASTFATTSYADLPGTTYTFVPNKDPTQTEAPGTPLPSVTAIVDWSLDVTKATTTTGTCALFANGAIIPASSRTIDVAAKEGTMAEQYRVALTSGGSQVIKLQCKSGDTAVFTVNQGQINTTISY